MNTKIIAIIFCGILLILVVDLVRREKLTFKYAFGWIAISVLGLFFALFEDFLFNIAFFFGFAVPSNFIFFCMLSALVLLSLLMTIFLCQQNNRNDKIAQKLGILESEIGQIKKDKDAK